MEKNIIYINEDGGISVIAPSKECLLQYSIKQIAEKDTPPNCAYKVIDSSVLPWEWPQETWEVDESLLNDGIGNESNLFEDVE
jgi:hypothetical protein